MKRRWHHLCLRGCRTLLATTLKLAALLAAGVALAGAFFAVRVANGPLPLAALTPVIENALSASDGSFRVRIAGTVLSLADDRNSLEITTHGATIENRAGTVLAAVPELSLNLSFAAMLRGIIAPTRIIISEPELHLERDVDGKFQLGIGEAGTSSELTDAVIRETLARPNPDLASGYLNEISIRGARLTVEDHMLGAVWQAPRAAATVFRGNEGISGDLALAVDVENQTAELHSEFRYVIDDHRLTVGFTLADWEMAKLQRVAPVLAPLAGLRTPISGTVEFSLDTARSVLEGARADLTAGAGSIADPALPGGAVAIAGGEIKASYDTAAARLTVHDFNLDLGGPVVQVRGTVDGLDAHRVLSAAATGDWGGQLTIAGEAVAQRMPANDLGLFWPDALAHNARTWITTNIRDGIVDDAHLTTRFRLNPADPHGAALDEFGGTLKMRGLTVDYHNPLPPVRNVDGTATFDHTRMTLLPTSGTLKGERVTGGTIVITDLDVVDQWIDIQLDVTGPIRDALEVIDSKPLEYARQVGLDAARVEGTANAHLSFYFMLDHRTTFDQVKVGVQAQLSDAVMRDVAFGQDLTDAALKLRLDRTSLQVDGTGKLAGAPSTIGWLQYFKPRDGLRSQYTVRIRLDDAARRAIGFYPQGDAITGPVDVNATLKSYADNHADASVALDLQGAAISVADLNWAKSAGVPASAKVDLDLVNQHLIAIREATIKGQGADVRLSAAFGKSDQSLQRLDLKRFVLGDTDITGTVARRPEGGWRADLQGASLDATALAANLDKPGASKEEQPPIVFNGKFDRMILGPKREAQNVVLQLYSDGLHWQTVRVDAAPFGSGALKLRFGEVGGEHPFTFAASDFGAAMRLLDISDHIAGGQISASGKAEDVGPVRTFSGQIDGSDYQLVKAPVMAKLLSLASLSGIGSLLAGEGIPFSRLKADFSATDGRITVKQMRAYGGALGINVSGTVDLDKSKLDLEGTLVPAYTLNSILGYIPVIGNLLQGGEGQGIFAAAFHTSGALDDPKISVNPLSALAPGVLRNLFLFEGNSGTPTTAPGKDQGAAK
ncbi:MAG: AsmA-like C-terminal domain-containing protein [Alphaproteobacteria bacterium]|nr:AsmA-like C-terminal domain-containing protein [Alphaproteobacteria bacterium]